MAIKTKMHFKITYLTQNCVIKENKAEIANCGINATTVLGILNGPTAGRLSINTNNRQY